MLLSLFNHRFWDIRTFSAGHDFVPVFMHALCFRITPALMGRALSQWECFKHIVIVWCLCLYVTSSQSIDCSEIWKSIWGFGEFVILQPLVFANVCNLSSIVICWCFNWNWCENHNSSIITYSLHSSSGKYNHKNYHTPILFGCSGFDGPVFFTWQGVMQCPVRKCFMMFTK